MAIKEKTALHDDRTSDEAKAGCPEMDEKIFELYEQLINPAYPSFLRKLGLDKTAIRAEGATITDSEGKTYIDCVGGYGLANIGHNHPLVVQALINQLQEKQQATKPFITELSVRLAEMLSKSAPGNLSCTFLCNSGSEAIDNAIKLARLYSGKKEIIAFENSFHGYTFGALSASGIPAFKRLFEPMLPGIINIPFGDIEALNNAITDNTAAILLEPIQHEAGVFLPPTGYLEEIRQICDKKGILLILDEIKTGLGKTGRMFACESFGIVPDILVLGKSLGGGLLPIGALIAPKSLWKKFGLSFPMSASSYAWNILACRAAITTIQVLHEDGLLDDCRQKGLRLLEEFKQCVKKYPKMLKSASGLGLLIGIETALPQGAMKLSKEMIKQGVIAVAAFGNASVLMIEPPIIISDEQIEKVLSAFHAACDNLSINA